MDLGTSYIFHSFSLSYYLSLSLSFPLFSSVPQVLEGCVCVNPGHLTRKKTGGTFVKLVVPELPAKPDLSSEVAISVVHI